MCDLIRLFVHEDGMHVKEIVVNRLDTINSLCPPDQRRCFLFNNSLLCSAFTFAFYGIPDGSHIFTYIQTIQKRATRARGKVKEFLQSKLKSTVNMEKHLEIAKLKDKFFSRIEGSYRVYQRVVNKFDRSLSEASPSSDADGQRLNLDGAREPSTNALPVLWTSDESSTCRCPE